MNAAHLHLALNHLPVLGALFGALLLAIALTRRSDELARAGLGVLVVAALLSIAVLRSGDAAEDQVEDIPGVSESMIEEHEEAAEAAAVGLGLAGVVSLAGLVLFRRAPRLPRGWTVAALVLAVVASGLMGRAANLGGRIRHSEIRSPAGAADSPAHGGDHERRDE